MKDYSVPFTKVAVTTAQDLFEIVPADDKPVEIFGMFISQSSDFGDAQAEIIPYKVIRGHTAAGTGGTAWTKRSLDPTDAEAGFTAGLNRTAAASGGTEELLHANAFNVMVGEALWLPEGAGWKVNQNQSRLVVRMASAPTDELIISGTLYCREM